MRLMLVDETTERSPVLRQTLQRLGHAIAAEITNAQQLYDAVREYSPDAVIINTASPSRDALAQLGLITKHCPRPIILFSQDAQRASIREAVNVGVTAYIVNGLTAERITPIIETAIAHFEVAQSVQTELQATRNKLAERKLIERAKGLLMQEKNLSEEDAYRLLRKLAMDRSAPLAEVAEQVITYAKLLG